MILAFDTSSAACTAALFDGSGTCVAKADEVIGRGHAERLVPMIGELMDGRTSDEIVVGVGPGSFTGIRVAIAAAQGMAIGWNARLHGMSSLALLAAGACAQRPDTPLTQAAVRNDVAALRQLLDAGHKPDEGGDSWTALIWASRSGSIETPRVGE